MRGVTAHAVLINAPLVISTRTPHAGSDPVGFTAAPREVLFQPALPMRGVTHARLELAVLQVISTRTPHAGSDCNIMCKFTASINI